MESHRALEGRGLDLTPILYQPEADRKSDVFRSQEQDHGLEKSLDVTRLLDICKPAIERGEKVKAELPIINVNRVVGTITGGEITKKHGPAGPARRHGAFEIQRQRRPEFWRIHSEGHDA